MTNEEQRPEGEQVPHAEGPEANAAGPAAHEEQDSDFTVEDILDAEQTAAAKAADGASEDSAAGADAAAAEAADGDAAADDPAADEANPYLEDLRRLTAEYANYRKRTEDNAQLERDRAKASVVGQLLSVLDDFDRAEQHGDLPEGSAVAAIAQKMRGTLERLGLTSFGEKGEAFDPQKHEAIAQVPVPGEEPNTVLDVVERGYRLGNVELRPAKVAVVAENG